jgi:acetyltransferase-like isoleucine patch superfamily enzyme
MGSWSELYKRAVKNPYLILPGLLGLINGYLHKIKFLITFKKVSIGKAFRVYGTFKIKGPGKVIIGDNCFVIADLIKPVTLATNFQNAEIILGNKVGLNGTTIQCYNKIAIKDLCNIADAYIVDSPAHSLSSERRNIDDQLIKTAPVIIEENVWISTNVVVSYGVTIGKNSVIGAMSLVRENIPADCFYAGNPARFIKKIPEKHQDNYK